MLVAFYTKLSAGPNFLICLRGARALFDLHFRVGYLKVIVEKLQMAHDTQPVGVLLFYSRGADGSFWKQCGTAARGAKGRIKFSNGAQLCGHFAHKFGIVSHLRPKGW